MKRFKGYKVKKYMVTEKESENVYIRTDSLQRAISEAKKHKYAIIFVFKSGLGAYDMIKKSKDGEVFSVDPHGKRINKNRR